MGQGEHWYLFPTSIGIATVAMASGVEGATFFAPLFLLGLGLPPEVAIGAGLLTEVFGFASGVAAYVRRRLIDYRLAGSLLLVTVPLALVGTWASARMDAGVLKAVLGVGLAALGLSFLRAPDRDAVERLDRAIGEDYGPGNGETCLALRDGELLCYTVCNRAEGRAIAGVGALFLGMISTGLGEMNGYFLLQRCRVPSRVAVATSVLVVAVTALFAASGHVLRFARAGGDALGTVLGIAVFTVPGVVIGGQLGSAVARRIPQRLMERGLGVLFLLVAGLTLAEVVR